MMWFESLVFETYRKTSLSATAMKMSFYTYRILVIKIRLPCDRFSFPTWKYGLCVVVGPMLPHLCSRYIKKLKWLCIAHEIEYGYMRIVLTLFDDSFQFEHIRWFPRASAWRIMMYTTTVMNQSQMDRARRLMSRWVCSSSLVWARCLYWPFPWPTLSSVWVYLK